MSPLILAALLVAPPAPAPPPAPPLPPADSSVPAIDAEPDIMKLIDRNRAYADPRIALTKLMRGNRRFQAGRSIHPRQGSAFLRESVRGQEPFAAIMGCSDSRVPAEIVFDQGLGDLFLVRTAGQVPAAASFGSLEFAVGVLKTKLIVVLGHDKCGAVDAAMKRPEALPGGYIVSLVNGIKGAVKRSEHKPGVKLDNAIRQNVADQVEELRDLEPMLSRRYMRGEILVVGAVYHLESGQVEFLPETLVGLPRPVPAG